ncbi:MAG: hypothetical protein NTY76_01285, partial [Candidatus Omnitrophica bacterium]|nr:hypothetical protein [Candidatus Omnitrophota bacterium]
KDFDKMKDGDVGEVHLATEYQKIELGIVSHELPDLGERMATYLEGLMRDNPKSYAKFLPMWELAFGRRTLALGTIEPDDPDRETKNKLYNELAATQYEKTREEIITEILGDSMPKGLKGKLKDLVKELPGPFKRELMNLPQRVRNIVDKALYEEFSTILEKLGASNTKELIEKIIPFAGYPVITPPRSQALQNAVERSAVGPLEAQSVDELLNRIDNTTQVTKDSVVVTNHGRFVERTVDYLALTAGLSGDSDTRAAAQTLLDELAASFNFKFGSSSDLNMFAGEGKEKNLYYATIIPVFNGTTAMYDKLRDSFKAVKESQKEAIMLELAMSKTRASREELSIFTASIIAAAIREGYEGLIFVQGDHYQVSGEGLVERELRGVAGPLRQAILDAGGASIDIDTGIYPKLLKAGDKDAIETVLGVKDNVVDQYLNRHPELVKDLSGEGVKLLRLGLAVQLGFGHDAIADTTQPVRSYAQIMASDGKGEHFATGYRQEVAPGKKRPVALQKAIAQRDFGISEDISDATKEVEFLTTGAVATSTTKLTSAPDLSKIVVIMKTDLPMAVTVGAEEEYSNTLLQEYHKMKQELKKHFANGVIEVTTKEELEREMALLIGSGFKVIVLDDGTLTKDVKDGDIQGKAGENYCVVTTDAVKNSDPLMVPFINLNAMAMMGVGVLNKDVTLFEIAYKIFTGNEAPKEIVDSLTKQALWIIKVLPRIIKLTGAIYDHKKIRELFLAAA